MQYAVANGTVTCARPDATFTTRPREARSAGSAAAVIRHGPSMFTSNTVVARSSGGSPALCANPTPALLTSTSRPPPRRSIASATARSTESGSVTSHAMRSPDALMSSPTTSAPRSRSCAAAAAPMPLAAPVMITRESAIYPGEARVEPVGHVVHDLLALGLVQDLVEEAVVALERFVLRAGPFGHHLAAGYRHEPVRGAVHDEKRQPETRDRLREPLDRLGELRDGARRQLAVVVERVVVVVGHHLRVAAHGRRVDRDYA